MLAGKTDTLPNASRVLYRLQGGGGGSSPRGEAAVEEHVEDVVWVEAVLAEWATTAGHAAARGAPALLQLRRLLHAIRVVVRALVRVTQGGERA